MSSQRTARIALQETAAAHRSPWRSRTGLAVANIERWISPYSLQPVHHRTSSIIGHPFSSAVRLTPKSRNIHRRRRRERGRQDLDFLLDDEALDLLARKRRRAAAELVFAGLVASFVLRKGAKHKTPLSTDCAGHVKAQGESERTGIS